jgi:hypothetical protein
MFVGPGSECGAFCWVDCFLVILFLLMAHLVGDTFRFGLGFIAMLL